MWSKRSEPGKDISNLDGWKPEATTRSSTGLWEQNRSYEGRLTISLPSGSINNDDFIRRQPTGSISTIKPCSRNNTPPTITQIDSVEFQKKTPNPEDEAQLGTSSCNHETPNAVVPNATTDTRQVRPQIIDLKITTMPIEYPAPPTPTDPDSPQTKRTFLESSVDHTESSSETSVGTSHPDVVEVPMVTPFDILWQRYQRQRINTWTLRSKVQRARSKLRGIQELKAAADDALFRFVNSEGLLGPDFDAKYSLSHQKKWPDLMQDCQAIRDEYGPLEDDCNHLEDQLSNEESKQHELEAEFQKRLEQGLPELRADSAAANLNIRDTSSAPGPALEDLKVTNLHPLATEFLSKLGDLYLLNEQYNDLLDERQYLEEEGARRKNVNLPLNASDQAFIENFEVQEKELARRLDFVENEVEAMRKDCLARGLIDEFDEPTTLTSQEKTHFKAEKGLYPENNLSEYAKFPVLLPRPGSGQEVEVDMESLVPLKDDQPRPQKRVNEWLLEQLRTSPLDVRLLASMFEDFGGGKTNDPWQFYVLSVWFRDDTFPSNADLEAYSSSLTTHAPSRSTHSSIYHF
jgi:hypothetical protein